MRNRYKDVLWGIFGGLSLTVIAGLPQAHAQGNQCHPDPALAVVKDARKLIADHKYLNMKQNCARVLNAQVPKVKKKDLDTQIDNLLNEPATQKVLRDGIKNDFTNSIDFLVKDPKDPKKSFEDYGVVLNSTAAKAFKSSADAYHTPNHSGVANEGYSNVIKKMIAPFQEGQLKVTDETRGRLAVARNTVIDEYSSDFQKSTVNDAAFKAKIKSIVDKQQCVDGFNLKIQAEQGMRTAKVTDKVSVEDAKAALLDQAANGRKGSDPDQRDSSDPIVSAKSWAYVCSPPHLQYAKLEPAPVHIPLTLNEKEFFEDNLANLSADRKSIIARKIAEQLKPKNPLCKRKLVGVHIETSSNLNRNTCSNLTEKECPDEEKFSYAFADLSVRRANELASTVSGSFPQAKVSVNPAGANGDGTSGPCPYGISMKDGSVYALEKTDELKKQLAESRYGKLNLDILEEGSNCNVATGDTSATLKEPKVFVGSKCFHVDVSCKYETAAK